MKATELRIGNLLQRLDDTIVEVTSTDISIIDSENPFSPKLKPKPIPLTDEWFIKWGFFKDGEYWSRGIDDYKFCFKYRDWAKNWALYQEFTDSPDPEDDGKKYPISFDIEYVHQLQNLWFALLHKEIKENEN